MTRAGRTMTHLLSYRRPDSTFDPICHETLLWWPAWQRKSQVVSKKSLTASTHCCKFLTMRHFCHSAYRGSSAEASDTDSNSRFDDASASAPWDPAADAAAHVHTPDVERRSSLRLAGPQFSFPRIDYDPELKSPYDLEPSQIRVGNGPASMHEQRSPSVQGRHSRKPSFPTADFEPDTPTQVCAAEHCWSYIYMCILDDSIHPTY